MKLLKKPIKKARVFLDTTVLLNSFLSFRRFKDGQLEKSQMQSYMIDIETEKFTFEKCIFEAYMAFRGVGGKKPDEGRRHWANTFLNKINDPDSLSKLISKYHSDINEMGFWWINQIEEFSPAEAKENNHLIRNEDHIKFQETQEKLKQLKMQREMFLNLCDDFYGMIQEFQVDVLSYHEIFGNIKDTKMLISSESPLTLDSFVKNSAIPSEDFEIIFCAERIGTDIFVTEDKKLITCAKSLGLNSFLSPAAFCRGNEYEEKKMQWKINTMYADL